MVEFEDFGAGILVSVDNIHIGIIQEDGLVISMASGEVPIRPADLKIILDKVETEVREASKLLGLKEKLGFATSDREVGADLKELWYELRRALRAGKSQHQIGEIISRAEELKNKTSKIKIVSAA